MRNEAPKKKGPKLGASDPSKTKPLRHRFANSEGNYTRKPTYCQAESRIYIQKNDKARGEVPPLAFLRLMAVNSCKSCFLAFCSVNFSYFMTGIMTIDYSRVIPELKQDQRRF